MGSGRAEFRGWKFGVSTDCWTGRRDAPKGIWRTGSFRSGGGLVVHEVGFDIWWDVRLQLGDMDQPFTDPIVGPLSGDTGHHKCHRGLLVNDLVDSFELRG